MVRTAYSTILFQIHNSQKLLIIAWLFILNKALARPAAPSREDKFMPAIHGDDGLIGGDKEGNFAISLLKLECTGSLKKMAKKNIRIYRNQYFVFISIVVAWPAVCLKLALL